MAELPESKQLSKDAEPKEAADDAMPSASTKALLCTAIGLISGLAVQLTKVDEIAFTTDETDALADAWSPFITKDLPPIWGAVITTLVIVGGKVVVFARVKGLQRGIPAQDKSSIIS